MFRRILPISRLLLIIAMTALGSAHATPINNSFGLSTPVTTLGFDEFGANGVPVTNQYASQGVLFPVISWGPLRTYNSQGFSGFNGWALNNGGDFEIQFLGTVTEAAFSFLTNPGVSSFQAFLGDVPVEQFSSPTSYSWGGPGTWFGFTGITFDTIKVQPGGQNGAFRLDNLQFSEVAYAAVPEPGTAALLALGLCTAGIARRRRIA